ncbi:serine/threonine protein kinase [Parafrankia soli]|uniref:Serine/threonine protein kinase n=1 Tax=Parafrankia soli TaxID=2599596 RepID=A0A1S1Q5P6_9ACTN|nr:protein kinase [Parafrankia soli]OHV28525.1 serine/threonine protein kinase [Parafrankia soli]CAI7978176.1 eukaryotic-like serine/threonine-protein kinase [Frankia sp. Hr75.2]
MPVVDRARVAAALPGYGIGGELGSGAFGLVLAGYHQELDRRVAVKVLSSGAAEAAADFRTEARLLSRLDHPHIVRTYDYVTRGDLCLLVMEMLPGGTLTHRVMRPEAACAVGLAVADALAHAHAHGVLHRDIKPANILFTDAGQPKITDFGISKVFEGSASTASRVVGTPRYMAPEQITGDRLSPATDLYALGVVLYELFTGASLAPPSLPLPVLLRHHTEVVPPPPPGVPAPLAAVLMRSLAKRPEDRHPSARAFAIDLARAATAVFGRHWLDRAGIPIHLADDVRQITTRRFGRAPRADDHPWRGAGGPGPAGRVRSRLPAVLLAGGGSGGRVPLAVTALAVLLALVAGGGVGWAVWGQPEPAPPAPPAPPPAWQPELATGTITTVFGAGSDGFSGDGGPAVQAEFDRASDLTIDAPRGYVYVADTDNHRIRRVDRAGTITTVAGTGADGFSGDGGPATEAQLDEPTSVAVAPDGTLYVADTRNHRVRRIGRDGIITTIAGQDEFGFAGEVSEDGLAYSGDGLPAVNAKLNYPNTVLMETDGSLLIADGENNRVRRIGLDGIITTIAGTGAEGFGGDGGPATSARFSYPSALARGPDGSLYVADQDNHRVRRIAGDGTISTLAGTGKTGYSGDGGPADQAQINAVGADLVVDAAGNVYLSDPGSNRVRRIAPDGTITTIAGTGVSKYSGNGGPATAAELVYPGGLALDQLGNLYIADGIDSRVRAVRLPPGSCAAAPCPTSSPAPGASPAPAGPVPPATAATPAVAGTAA